MKGTSKYVQLKKANEDWGQNKISTAEYKAKIASFNKCNNRTRIGANKNGIS